MPGTDFLRLHRINLSGALTLGTELTPGWCGSMEEARSKVVTRCVQVVKLIVLTNEQNDGADDVSLAICTTTLAPVPTAPEPQLRHRAAAVHYSATRGSMAPARAMAIALQDDNPRTKARP